MWESRERGRSGGRWSSGTRGHTEARAVLPHCDELALSSAACALASCAGGRAIFLLSHHQELFIHNRGDPLFPTSSRFTTSHVFRARGGCLRLSYLILGGCLNEFLLHLRDGDGTIQVVCRISSTHSFTLVCICTRRKAASSNFLLAFRACVRLSDFLFYSAEGAARPCTIFPFPLLHLQSL